jgi:two-component system phosphate regulon sensor histidine kinase PhoR
VYRLRRRIALTALAASAAALMAVWLLVGPGLRRRAVEQLRGTLLAEARLIAHVVEEPLSRGASTEELDALVDEAANEVSARVTIIATDGRVLADSSLSGPGLAAMENHLGRPEVTAVLAWGSGTSVRHSATVGVDFLYAAVPVRHTGRLVGISRVALSLAGVEAQVAELRRAVWVALSLAFALTAVLSAVLAPQLAGPLREIMETARQFAAGNLAARIRVRRADELGELARILNQTAGQLQERLAENIKDRARTEAILTAMEDGVLAVDHEGFVLLANETLRRGFGLQDAVGRHYVEVLRQREVGEIIEEILRSGERRTAEVEIRHRVGVFALTGATFPGAEGEPPGAVLTFHDVTERRRLEQVRRDFVANASHELRTPLTSIRGFVEALEDGAINDPATAQRFLGKIRTHAGRMGTLVEDLLTLSRIESAEGPAHFDALHPGEIADDVVASFSDRAQARSTILACRDAGAPTVVSDPDRLRRILENLVDNALKYTPEGGHVEVSASPGAGGGAVVEVRDDGPGIASEHLHRIFERFYRVDKARSRELGGTGLGLAIVRHLAESIGVAVTVASEPGKGTTFSVSIPAWAAKSRAAEPME